MKTFKCWLEDEEEDVAEIAPSYVENFHQAVYWFAEHIWGQESRSEMTIMVRDSDGKKRMFTVEARVEFDIFEEDV